MIPTVRQYGWAAVLLLVACADAPPPPATGVPAATGEVRFSEREGKVRDFPCSQCHDKVDPLRVAADGTKKHQVTLAHGEARCTMCHLSANLDRLALPAGGDVSFNEPHRLCGQCHHDKVRDWSVGAHGKVLGSWSGMRHRLACTDCHDPHSPAIQPVNALPGPPFPKHGVRKGAH